MSRKDGKRGRQGRNKSIIVRIDAEVLEEIKKTDPLLSNLYSDSAVVDTVLKIYLKYRRQIYELIMKETI